MKVTFVYSDQEVSKEVFIKAWYKSLVEFGYNSLTEKVTASEVDKIIKGEPLTIIGEFMKKGIKIKADDSNN